MQLIVANTKNYMKAQADKLVVQSVKNGTTKNGKAFVRLNVSEILFSQKQNKEYVAGYFNLVFWDNANMVQHMQPGSALQLLDGDLRVNTYNDRNGQKQKSVDITVRNFQELQPEPQHVRQNNNNGQNYQQPQQQYQGQPAQQQQVAPQYQQPQYAAPQGQPAPQYQQPAPQPQQGGYPQAPTNNSYGNYGG